MIPSSSLVTLVILKKLLSPAYSILHLLRDCLVMVRRLVLNKRVPNSIENWFVSISQLRLMRMISLADFVWWEVRLFGIMAQSSKPWSAVRFYYLTRLTWLPTKFFAFNQSWKVKEFSWKRLASLSNLLLVSMLLLLLTPRVRVLMMDALSELTSWMKRFWSVFLWL